MLWFTLSCLKGFYLCFFSSYYKRTPAKSASLEANELPEAVVLVDNFLSLKFH